MIAKPRMFRTAGSGSILIRLALGVLLGAWLSGCAFLSRGGAKPTADRQTGERGVEAGSSARPERSSPIWFRVMLADADGNQVVEGGELVTVTVEVMNTGPETARHVQVIFTGSPSLLGQFPSPVLVGDMRKGERKRLAVSGRLPEIELGQQVELLVSVEGGPSGTEPPGVKKFVITPQPKRAEPYEVQASRTQSDHLPTEQARFSKVVPAGRDLPTGGRGPGEDHGEVVEVDRVPAPVPGLTRPEAFGLVIGVGTFRDPHVPGIPFARRDAEVVAKYFQAAGGISSDRIKVLVDDFAFKEDVSDVIEYWLPHQVRRGGTVFAFFSGRAVVDPATGAVSLIPHDGQPGSPFRLISLHRLQTALASLPVQRALLFLDVTLASLPEAGKGHGKVPVWNQAGPALEKGKLVQIVGISGVQEAHQYGPGRHGLFTYFLLKGFQGAAEQNGDGVVTLGELFEYVRANVSSVAHSQYQSAQMPLSLPALTPEHTAWGFPVVRLQ